MSEIIPAVLPKDYDDLEDKMNMVAGIVPIVHVDVEDGTLTERETWPFTGDEGQWQAIQDETEGMPAWEEINFEAHLMVKEPMEQVDEWITAGAERIIIHLEVFDDPFDLALALRELRNRFTISQTLNIEVGLAVNFDTDIESIFPFVLEADFIHLMSIAEIGAQGHGFEQGIFDKIEALKAEFPDTIVSIDGGVNAENAASLLAVGADRLVVGSAIYGAEDPEDSLYELLDINHDHGELN